MRTASFDASATAALVMAMLLWGSSLTAMKYALDHFDPMIVVFGRLAAAAAVILPFWSRLNRESRPAPGDLRLLLFMALCEPCLYYLFEIHALRFTAASQAGMITALLPAMIAAAAAPALGERPTKRTMVGLAAAVMGAVWLSAAADEQSYAPNPLLGNFLEFLAMVCATGYIITAKKLCSRYSPHFLTAFQAVAGCLFFLPLCLLPGTTLPQSFPMLPTLLLIYLGVIVNLGAYGCYNYGLSRIPAGQAANFINLIPVFALIIAAVFLGESFNAQQYAASVLVLAGVFTAGGGANHTKTTH